MSLKKKLKLTETQSIMYTETILQGQPFKRLFCVQKKKLGRKPHKNEKNS